MNVEKFYETLESAIELDRELKIQSVLEAIRDALSNIASSPAQPQYQSALASSLSTLREAASALSNSATPLLLESLAEMGGKEFFDPSLAIKIQDSIEKNAMTPSVARDFVTTLAANRAQFIDTMKSTREGLQKLGVHSPGLGAGNADAHFLIPRELFKNELGEFAKELIVINKLVRDVCEAVTGSAEPVQLEALSSSIPTVAIMAEAGVVLILAEIVDKFLTSWERIERIRKVRAELADLAVRKSGLDDLTDEIKRTVANAVTESVNLALEKYPGDHGRKNELATSLQQDTKRLFGQIERGLTIQFNVAPKEDASEEEKIVLNSLGQIRQKLQFPAIASEPILLTDGEVLGDPSEAESRVEETPKNGSTARRAKRNSRQPSGKPLEQINLTCTLETLDGTSRIGPQSWEPFW